MATWWSPGKRAVGLEGERVRETVVQFGAGNVGRGFTGQLFTDAGFEVVFVDVTPALVEGLNRERSYSLRLVGPDLFETLRVGPVRAVSGRDVDAVAEEVARCRFACTAVGVPAIPHIIPALAEGIRRRSNPLDVILCENQLNASEMVRGYLGRELDAEQLARVGLIESVVSRMVPVLPEEERRGDPLLAVAEDYPVLPVDANAFVGEPPPVPDLKLVPNFPAYFDRKLYVHNAGHAVAAYQGYLHGCRYIHEAMAVPDLLEQTRGAMEEAGLALQRKHGFTAEETRAHRENLLRRFANAALGDTVARVGRDPVRKLRPDDRLVGAALTCLDWDVAPACLAQGIAAALRFDPPDDPGAAQVQALVREHGPAQALLQLTGLSPDSELGRRVLALAMTSGSL